MTISNTTRFELTQWSSGDDEFSREQLTLDFARLGLDASMFLSGTSATPPTAVDANTRAFYWDKINSKLYFRGDTTGSGSTVADWVQVHPVLPGAHIHADLQPLDADLTSLSLLSTTGIIARTAANTYATRSVAVSGTGLSISNADGVSGNMTIAINATANNTASTVVARDASGNFTAGTITAALTGNASTATTLATGRAFSISGDATAPSVSFNGSTTVPLVLTLATVNATIGSFGDHITVPVVTVNAKGLVTSVVNTAIRSGTTTTSGLVQLNDSVSSTSTTTAATANAVRLAYDRASAALSSGGGSVTGKITTVSTSASTANILFSQGSVDPTTPVSGDFWNNSGVLKFYNGTANKTISFTDGNVSTATALQTTRTFTITGDVATTNAGSTAVTATFDGTANPTFTVRIKNDSHTHDTQYYTQTQVNNARMYQYGNITAGGVDTSGSQLPASGTRTTPRIYVQSNDPTTATGYVGITGDIWFQI